ncbi:MAG: hypothetical protein GEU79_19380 [Acidimicrobiia bacterium]|nr:hypothetical protein [Acidimicrobiia bacterium]
MTRKDLVAGRVTAIRAVQLVLILLVLSMLVAVSVRAADDVFTDDEHSVFEGDIDQLAAIGVTIGCNPPDNDRYCPGRYFTRAQAAAFVRRALDIESATRDFFFDDGDSVFEDDINAIRAAGITYGCNPPHNWYFCPDEPITRGEMTAFLRRALIMTTDVDASDFNPSETVFTDVGHSVFQGDINALGNANIALSCEKPLVPAVQQVDAQFCPDDLMTRGQAAGFMRRALDG